MKEQIICDFCHCWANNPNPEDGIFVRQWDRPVEVDLTKVKMNVSASFNLEISKPEWFDKMTLDLCGKCFSTMIGYIKAKSTSREIPAQD